MRTRSLVLVNALALVFVAGACSKSTPTSNVSNVSNKPSNAAPANANAAPVIAALPGMDEATHAVFKAKCTLCHGQDGKGSGKAPDLFAVTDKHSADEWEAYLEDPKTFDKKNKMPALPMEADQRKLMAAWLAKTIGSTPPAEKATNAPGSGPGDGDVKKY